VPPLRRTVDELIRIEIFDRCMVVAAQALFALIPLVVVLAAFLPADLTHAGVQRFEDVTGLSQASASLVTEQVEPVGADVVRAQTGLIGLLVVLLSASSFARAVMRAYEKIWALPTIGGIRGRRRALAWLLGWLLGLQSVALVSWVLPDAAPVWVRAALKAAVVGLLWWWTLYVLLFARVSWQALAVPAFLTGVALTAYTVGSSAVMPHYAGSSADQFGTFGLVLAVATWLVGMAGVMIVAALVGRVLVEDPWLRRLPAYVRGALGQPERRPPPGGA
jgi:membrane protein